ncbi:hypothetical protein Tco_0873964 [Tanacetum coccineum]|uniref:Uncharacterized protein n=1 Tax=Tanacetum coccineum TaxID=301880 RepID=A0ABQ5BNY8_9ASTR
MGRNKAVGPNQLPIEAWKCLGDKGVKWLICLFNVIFTSAKMPKEWRFSEVIPIFKNNGDADTRVHPLVMIFAYNIMLVAESAEGLDNILEHWRETLEGIVIEQRVNVNQKARILELKRRNYEEHYSDIIYAISIKEDTAYRPFSRLKKYETLNSVLVVKMKVIKEESEIMGLLMIDDGFFTCDTPLEMIFNESIRLSEMDDDLFTYEVKIPELSYSSSVGKQIDDLDNGNLDVYERKLYLKYDDHTMVSNEVRESVIVRYGFIGQEGITDDELSNLGSGNLIEETEIAEILRIKTDIFQFKTPLCEAFKEFNYLLKIDVDNKDIPWVANMPWLDYGPWMEPSDDIEHVCKPFRFKNRHAKWPTCNWKKEKYCNGGDLPGVIQNGDMIYFEGYEWYKNLEEGELKDKALNSKAIFEGSKRVDEESSNNARTGINDHNETQVKQGWFDKHELMKDDDDDIGDFEDYLIRKDPPYYVNEEEERLKE